jgi:hypothetical protein
MHRGGGLTHSCVTDGIARAPLCIQPTCEEGDLGVAVVDHRFAHGPREPISGAKGLRYAIAGRRPSLSK